jgi:hypothetical protein
MVASLIHCCYIIEYLQYLCAFRYYISALISCIMIEAVVIKIEGREGLSLEEGTKVFTFNLSSLKILKSYNLDRNCILRLWYLLILNIKLQKW